MLSRYPRRAFDLRHDGGELTDGSVLDDAAAKIVETMLSCVNVAPGWRRPIAASTAITADVPVPHGDRSTSASANTVTFRRSAPPVEGPVKIVPYSPCKPESSGWTTFTVLRPHR